MRLGWIILAAGACCGFAVLAFLWQLPEQGGLEWKPYVQQTKREPLTFSLSEEKSDLPVLGFPKVGEELMFSFPLPRPDKALKDPPLLVRCRKKKETKRVTLPARLDLQYEKGVGFSSSGSPFWMELQRAGNQIEGVVFAQFSPEAVVEVEKIAVTPQKTPLAAPAEFSEGSPFRILGESKWWGRDLFLEKYGEGIEVERLCIGSEMLDLAQGEWLVWRGGKWEKALELPDDLAIAHIEKVSGKELVFEGWEGDAHIRIALERSPLDPFHVRAEELFHALRIRSEKQISCMLEKQCLILRVGDWVLKGEGCWKVLKREEEREAFFKGKLGGELFVLDKIVFKQGQKMIEGTLFDGSRSQKIAIELPAFSSRNAKGKNP